MSMGRLPRGEEVSGRTELLPPPVEPMLDRKRGRDGSELELVRQTRTYELITPLFGGGVEPRAADPVTRVRASEVRGQLRFWWRACRGGSYNGDLQRMREAEAALWGAASTEKEARPSQVQVRAEVTARGSDRDVFRAPGKAAPDWRTLAYAAFPLQGDEKKAPDKVLEGVEFSLVLIFPASLRAEVEAALWAWETFGGLGGRTRRGFGALRLVNIDNVPVGLPEGGRVEAEIRAGLRKHVVNGTWPCGVPHLSSDLRMRVTSIRSDSRDAWEHLIRCLKDFRQSRNAGISRERPGRSRWPEPDEIRRLTHRRCPRHAESLSGIRKFPRAAFGLPIAFHFRRDDVGDPEETVLKGADKAYERLASPLILRPLACKKGAVGLAAVLEGTGPGTLPGGLILQKKDDPDTHWPARALLEPSEAAEIQPLQGRVDVLQAFLDTVR